MRHALYVLTMAIVAVAVAGVMLLRENIGERKAEARQIVFRLVDLDETQSDPAEWGKNFPRQYDSYRRTVDMERTRFGGSEADPSAAPSGEGSLTTSKIEADPRLKTMWAGYAFAIDFREERGHAYMLQDQRETERVKQRPQPGACLNCHASITVPFRRSGLEGGAPGALTDALLSPNGMAQLMLGFQRVCAMPYADATKLAQFPVACIDCHDPQSMQLRVTRPGALNGLASLATCDQALPHLPSIERWRKGSRSRPYDPNREASRQEMRALVCGQCHVEYYFKGDGKLLTFPWQDGLKVEQILGYYDEPAFRDGLPFADWKHALTGAPVLKAQHPEFELWSQGIHARSGVACADCHMPYMREGAIKVSSHHVRSPLLDASASCQVCHPYASEEIEARVLAIQDRTQQLMNRALDALVALIEELQAAQAAGATERDLTEAWALQRAAQFRIDFVNAENSMGFHAPQEAARILGEAIDLARQGQLRVQAQRLAAR
jgi:nitrite reductase (cytochrome c-552)